MSRLQLQQLNRFSIAAAVFTALFLGALVAQSVSGQIGDRLGERPVIWPPARHTKRGPQ